MGKEEDIAKEEGLPQGCPLDYLKAHMAREKRSNQFLPMEFGVVFTDQERSALAQVYHRLREMGHGIPPDQEPDQNGGMRRQ